MTKSYIDFVKVEEKPKTSVYEVRSKSSGIVLGIVKWYGSWRQYCFFPESKTLWNRTCLLEIGGFVLGLMEDRKEKK